MNCHSLVGQIVRVEAKPGLGRIVAKAFLILAWIPLVLGSSGKRSGPEWPDYGADLKGTKYSSLDQINRRNVAQLKVAWVYHTGDLSDGTDDPIRSAFECTPVVVDGVMYLTTPFSRVIALDAESAKQLWTFDPKLNRKLSYPQYVNRGVAFWRRNHQKRLYLGTLDGRLFCLDAETGKPIRKFGHGGFVNLRKGVADLYPTRLYGMTSPPLVYKDFVIVGSVAADGEPKGPSGDVRAFHAESGELVWRFQVVPRPGEIGHDTWEEDSWMGRGGVNMWSVPSCDDERGVLYLPLTSPAADSFGRDRKGQNLYGNSLVALDAISGRRIWNYQLVHHDVWDYDLPAQPNLVEIRRGSKSIPAVVQVTKMGLVFVFDRVTGEPLFEIEERKVPPSEIPGEQTWPTQPFPLKPPPIARHVMAEDDWTRVTAESRAECLSLFGQALPGVIYQPWRFNYTIHFPGGDGGANWGGASYDPGSNWLFVNTMDLGRVNKVEPLDRNGTLTYRLRGRLFWDSKKYPCQRPPWGRLSAIDLNTGEIRWQVPLGIVDELVDRGLPPTGTLNIGGSIVTAGGLVFIAATNDARFRAFDKDTGRELWVTRLPASGHATPMTFEGRRTGKQFVVIAAGGGHRYSKTFSDALVAFSLP